jgi:hypothetical protein
MGALGDLVDRYRAELRRLIARRRRLDAEIAARREVLRDVLAALGESPEDERQAPPRRGTITQAEAVRRVLGEPDASLTAAEIYARALAAGAGGTMRSLRNVLSRGVKDGVLVTDRSTFPMRYRIRDVSS